MIQLQRKISAQKHLQWLVCLAVLFLSAPVHCVGTELLPQAGPEQGGLRLRLTVSPVRHGSNESYTVRAELINVATNPLTVSALWAFDGDKGDFKDYFEAALSIETDPKIVLFAAQVVMDHRTTPQPTMVIPANGTVSLEWKSSGRRLKNKLTRPTEVMNPYFPTEGLFSVRAEFKVAVSGLDQPVLLRSNEQLVPIGGSSRAPKASSARVIATAPEKNQATLDRGALNGVEAGDKFLVRTGFADFWLLTVTSVEDRWSTAVMKISDTPFPGRTNSTVVKPAMDAAFVPRNAKDTSWMRHHGSD